MYLDYQCFCDISSDFKKYLSDSLQMPTNFCHFNLKPPEQSQKSFREPLVQMLMASKSRLKINLLKHVNSSALL
jgi:hypothetical protein